MPNITQEIVRHPYEEQVNSSLPLSDCNALLDELIEEESNDFMYVFSAGNEVAGPLCLEVRRESCHPKPDPNTPIIQRTEIYWMMEYEAYTYMLIEGVLLLIVFLIILYRLKRKRKKVK